MITVSKRVIIETDGEKVVKEFIPLEIIFLLIGIALMLAAVVTILFNFFFAAIASTIVITFNIAGFAIASAIEQDKRIFFWLAGLYEAFMLFGLYLIA